MKIEKLLELGWRKLPQCTQGQCHAKAEFQIEGNPNLVCCGPHLLSEVVMWMLPNERPHVCELLLPIAPTGADNATFRAKHHFRRA